MSNNTELAKDLMKLQELQAKVSKAQQTLQKFLPDKAKQKDEEENHASGSSVSIYVQETVTEKSSSTRSSEMSPANKKQRLTGLAFEDGKWKKYILKKIRTCKLLFCPDEILVNMKTWSEEHVIEFVDNLCKKVPMFYSQAKDEQLKQIRTFCEEKSIRFLSEEDDEESEEEEEDHDQLNEELTEKDEELAENDEEVTENDEVEEKDEELTENDEEEEKETDKGSLSEEY